jgi:epoxide hydrolase
VEKFKELTWPEDGLPEESVDRDRMLTDISLYWFTGTAGSAAQVYYEEMSATAWTDANDAADEADWNGGGNDWDGGEGSGWSPQRGTVPTAVLVSAHDVTVRRWAERDHNITAWTELEEGGHFLAMEAPDVLTADVRAFFRKLR